MAEREEARLRRVRIGQNRDNFSEAIPEPLERQIVEEFPPLQQTSVSLADLSLGTDRVPVGRDHCDLVPHDRQGAFIR